MLQQNHAILGQLRNCEQHKEHLKKHNVPSKAFVCKSIAHHATCIDAFVLDVGPAGGCRHLMLVAEQLPCLFAQVLVPVRILSIGYIGSYRILLVDAGIGSWDDSI